MASPFTTADPSDPGSGSMPWSNPADQPQLQYNSPKDLVSNALLHQAIEFPGHVYNELIKPMGQVFTGEIAPSMEPGPNQLSVPEYALGLAGASLGFRGLGFTAPEGALTTFPVYQGTKASQPFLQHSDDYLGTGEGTMYEGWGHYSAERKGIADSYRLLAGEHQVPLDENGAPLSYLDTARKYFEPGTIVSSYEGHDRVIRFNEPTEGDQFQPARNWSVDVQKVGLDEAKIRDKYNTAVDPADLKDKYYKTGFTVDPDLWTDIGPVRNHATYPASSDIERVGADRNWDMGQPGALIDINIIPEKNEYLDLNKPWRDQDPIVRDRLDKAFMSPKYVNPEHYDIREDTYIPPGQVGAEHEYMTGRDLYNSWVDQRSFEMAAAAKGGRDINHMTSPFPEQFKDAAAEAVSKDLDAAGVPGMKFLDRPSRRLGPLLQHDDNLAGMPGGFLTKSWIEDPNSLSPRITNVDDAVRVRANALRSQARSQQDWAPEAVKTFNDAADWLERENAAGRFSLNDRGRTRNFITVNPKNMQITHWNGRKVEPLPEGYNPSTGILTPPLEPPDPDPLTGLGNWTPDPGWPGNLIKP